MEKNDMKLVFAPGCFDAFEGSQEELDALVEQIKAAFESGELFESAEEVDIVELEENHPDVVAQLAALDSADRKLH